MDYSDIKEVVMKALGQALQYRSCEKVFDEILSYKQKLQAIINILYDYQEHYGRLDEDWGVEIWRNEIKVWFAENELVYIIDFKNHQERLEPTTEESIDKIISAVLKPELHLMEWMILHHTEGQNEN